MVLGKFTIWVIQEIITRAEEQWYSPEIIRQELQSLRLRFDSGELIREEFEDKETILFERLMEGRKRGIEG